MEPTTQEKLNTLFAQAQTLAEATTALNVLAQDIADDPPVVAPGEPATHEDVAAVTAQLAKFQESLDKLLAALPPVEAPAEPVV